MLSMLQDLIGVWVEQACFNACCWWMWIKRHAFCHKYGMWMREKIVFVLCLPFSVIHNTNKSANNSHWLRNQRLSLWNECWTEPHSLSHSGRCATSENEVNEGNWQKSAASGTIEWDKKTWNFSGEKWAIRPPAKWWKWMMKGIVCVLCKLSVWLPSFFTFSFAFPIWA